MFHVEHPTAISRKLRACTFPTFSGHPLCKRKEYCPSVISLCFQDSSVAAIKFALE